MDKKLDYNFNRLKKITSHKNIEDITDATTTDGAKKETEEIFETKKKDSFPLDLRSYAFKANRPSSSDFNTPKKPQQKPTNKKPTIKEYNLKHELGADNTISILCREAFLLAEKYKFLKLKKEAIKLDEMVQRIRYDNDNFYKVHFQKEILEKLYEEYQEIAKNNEKNKKNELNEKNKLFLFQELSNIQGESVPKEYFNNEQISRIKNIWYLIISISEFPSHKYPEAPEKITNLIKKYYTFVVDNYHPSSPGNKDLGKEYKLKNNIDKKTAPLLPKIIEIVEHDHDTNYGDEGAFWMGRNICFEFDREEKKIVTAFLEFLKK